MSKKEFLSQIMTTFEQNCSPLPHSIASRFEEIKEKLESLSEQHIEEQMTSVITHPAEEQPYHPDKLSYLLYEVFPEMEKLAKEANENQYELLQATNELRGELGMDTDPPFPE